VYAEVQLGCSLERLDAYARGAPVDSIEDAEMRRAHTDEVIATVSRGPDHEISSIGEQVGRCLDGVRGQGWIVTADQHHRLEAVTKMMLEGGDQGVAESDASLLEQVHRRGQQAEQARRSAPRMYDGDPLPAELHAELDCIEQKTAIQRGCLLAREWRNQACLGTAWHRGLADNNQSSAHSTERSTRSRQQS
jgi:hypothetical protein